MNLYNRNQIHKLDEQNIRYEDILLKSQEPFHPRFVKRQPSEVV